MNRLATQQTALRGHRPISTIDVELTWSTMQPAAVKPPIADNMSSQARITLLRNVFCVRFFVLSGLHAFGGIRIESGGTQWIARLFSVQLASVDASRLCRRPSARIAAGRTTAGTHEESR